MVVMLLLPSLAAMADVAASCPVEVVAVVVGDVEGFDKELVEAGSVHPLGTTVEVGGELAVVKHGQHAIPEQAQLEAVHVGLVKLNGRPLLLERIVVTRVTIERRLVPLDLRPARRDTPQLCRKPRTIQAWAAQIGRAHV